MYPKVVALDTDWTIFSGWLSKDKWGKGAGAAQKIEDNIKEISSREVQDKTNAQNKCVMYEDVPRIIEDILKNGAKLAIVSCNTSKDLCDRALYFFKVKDGSGKEKRLIELVSFDEVYNSEKTVHFEKIKGWAKCHYTDMILYDDEAINNIVEIKLGVTFQVSRDQKGLTWANYQQGISVWRRNKEIETPWLGNDAKLYPKKKFIGYSGMDLDTINLLEAGGRRHDRKEAARWGYSMYIADDPLIAKYFSDWIKDPTVGLGPSAKTVVCAIYFRDESIFNKIPKIWVPEDKTLQTNNVSGKPFDIAWSQENRDLKVESWGVKKPYILFARHHNMPKEKWGLPFPIPYPQRFNEMVIYPQVQEAQILIVRLSDADLAKHIRDGPHLHYEKKLTEWNITVPSETKKDFVANKESFA
ncbi:hypothetical protein FA15DRAFT_748747 [Coprinopsis marcescibilis]|uniref:Uncharacterized protein n=1 Tax=Coprinopsis marcescibilis TaxID=230819 RepID=A0A5C3KQC6_COPMA|nr:hypothetical protein FA15DRAFT_748747 [Coprinopsis marcescibilis]